MISHKSPISGVATYGNKYVATAGYDNVIILWDAESGRSIARGCHDHLVNQCTFSNDGKILVTSSSDYTARLWSVPSMKLKSVLNGHIDDVEAVAINNEKNLIATCSHDTTIRVFDFEGKQLKVIEGHEDCVTSVDWVQNSDFLVSSSDDGTVKFWNAVTGEKLKDLSLDNVQTDTIAIASDGTIFAGNDRGEIVTIREGFEPTKALAHKSGIKRLVYSNEVSKIISLSYDRTFKIWKFENGEITLESSHEFNNIVWPRSCDFLNKDEVVFGTFGDKYAQYNLKTREWIENGISPTYGINAVSEINGDMYCVGDAGIVFKNNSKINELGSLCNFIIGFEGNVITGGQTGEVFNAVTGEVYYQHNSPLNCGTNFIHKGRPALIVGTYTGEGAVFVLNEKGEVEFLKTVSFHDNAIKGISASSKAIFSVCATGAAAYHGTTDFECIHYIDEAHSKIANGCVNCGEEFASISRDLKLRIWKGDDSKVIDTGHINSIKSISSDDLGRYLILGDYTGFVSIYDKSKEDFIKHQRLSDFGISSICYSKTENKFIASSYDGKPYNVLIED